MAAETLDPVPATTTAAAAMISFEKPLHLRTIRIVFLLKVNGAILGSTVKSLCGTVIFLKGEVDQVDILFTNFISTLTQKPEVRTLLPVGELKAVSDAVEGDQVKALTTGATEFLFEPSPGEVFGALLPHYLNFQVYQILLEAKASEHSARMVAMKNATDNAKQLIKDLTLEYNKLRQGNITKELLEIAGGQLGNG